MKTRRWLVTTIREPFPVFFSHVSRPTERRPETAEGPFYGANSKSYDAPEDAAHVAARADYLRSLGWTVDVTEETR